eukprot:SAG22_NODE_403_length_11012_cov_12.141024_6_plen_205_part_00
MGNLLDIRRELVELACLCVHRPSQASLEKAPLSKMAVGRAACVCREFYEELSPRAKTIVHTIQEVEDRTGMTWGDPSMTSVTELHLDGNQITDITPLSALTSLTWLRLVGNLITDITPLSALTSLTELHLDGNQITDIAPLSALTSLTALCLNYNQITDIAPLSALTSLTALCLFSNPGKFSGNTRRDFRQLPCHNHLKINLIF